MTEATEFLTIQEVAKVLKVNDMTIRRMIARGEFAGVKVGRGVRVPKSDFEEYTRRAVAKAEQQRKRQLARLERMEKKAHLERMKKKARRRASK